MHISFEKKFLNVIHVCNEMCLPPFTLPNFPVSSHKHTLANFMSLLPSDNPLTPISAALM